MSNQMLKILIESACETGTISDVDRNLIEHKAKQMGVSVDKVNSMIQEQLSKNQQNNDEGLESGFISIDEIKNNEPVPPPIPTQTPAPVDKNIQQSKFTDVKPLSMQGAMSIVSQAKLYGKWIIIKRIKPEFKENKKYRELFMREFENAYHFDHPHIVRLLDKGEDSDGLYYTMEYIDGRPLSELFKSNGINNDSMSENIARQILDALSYVHKKQIYHRDLKPDNIYVTFRGDNVKILDFGLAAADNFDDDLLKVGTPRYASPEQMKKGFDVDQRADIYSFGKIFLELLTGKVKPEAVNSISNPAYKYIIEKSIKIDPKDRFNNCDEIVRVFNNPQSIPKTEDKITKTVKNIEPKPQKNLNEKKNLTWLWILLAVVVIGGGVGAYFTLFHDKGSSNNNNNKNETVLVSKADSLFKVGDYIEAKDVYESIKEKDAYVNSQIVTLNGVIDDFNEAMIVFDGKNIARSKGLFKTIVDEYPDFKDASEKLQECNDILKNVSFDDLQVESESGTNKLGLLNSDGYVIVDFQFDKISPPNEWAKSIIPVGNNGKYGFLDKNLALFAKCEYSGYTFNGNNLGLVKLGNGFKVSKNGKTVIISVDENGNGKIK